MIADTDAIGPAPEVDELVDALMDVLEPGLHRAHEVGKHECLTARLWVVRRVVKAEQATRVQLAAATPRAVRTVISDRLATRDEADQKADRVDPRAAGLALFGLTAATRGLPLSSRHRAAARAFGRSYGVFMRDYRVPLIHDIAQALFDAETETRERLRSISEQAGDAERFVVAQTEADFRLYIQFHQVVSREMVEVGV